MTISYSLAPNPKWYIADLVGRPLGGGYLATFSSLDHTQLNPVFQDPGGIYPWPYVTIPNVGSLGILFDENGSQGPFYFAFDTSLPDQLYYLEVYDSDGVLQWTIDDFTPGNGGGGSIITTAIDLENLVVNNVMWRNIGPGPTATSTFFTLAAGPHSALTLTASQAGPDIVFIKNNTSATDTVSFIKFPLGSTPLTGDVTPVEYLNYSCTNTPSGETQKLVQFPITHSVQNLSNQQMTVTIWARGNSGTTTLTLQWLQFFGDGGGASPSVITPIQTINLSNSWQKFSIQTTILSVSGMVLGSCGNDGLFLQVQYPLGASCSIDFTKPCAYLGTIAPTNDYHTYDMIDAILNSPRTGDIKPSYFNVTTGQNLGWMLMNDNSIGATSSGATFTGTYLFPLYNTIWNNITDTYAPVSGGRGASAVADFVALKTLTLPKVLGRLLGSYGSGAGLTARQCGQFGGVESVTIAQNQLPTIVGNVSGSNSGPSPTTPYNSFSGSPNSVAPGGFINVTNGGGGNPVATMSPFTMAQFFIKL